jgi:hypothetical protein
MSDFLEHKKTIDPAAWVARIPEKWRMPVMLGGPALLVILLMPLLFRDEKVRAVDRNTVASLALNAKTQSQQRAQTEAALDAALARKLAAEQPAPAPVAPPAAVADAARAAAAAASDAPPAAPPSYLAGAGSGAQQGQAPQLKTGSEPGGAAGSGNAVAAAPGKPAPKAAAIQTAAAPGPAPKLALKAFDWRGPGAGAGREALSGGPSGVSATPGLNFQSGGQSQTSAFVAGAGAYGHSGAAAGTSGGPSASAGSMGTANTVGMGGGAGASAPGGVDTSASDKMMKQCKAAQDKYQPKVDEQNRALNSYEKYRTDNNCKNIGCAYCNNETWNYLGGIYRPWCRCAANRCHAKDACANINKIEKDWKDACPMMGETKLDCSKT